MVSEHGMAWWSSTRSNSRIGLAARLAGVLLLAVVVGAAMPAAAAAQAVSASEREALVRLRVSQGGVPEEVDALLRHAEEAASKGLPVAPLTNKIREGLAKGAAPDRIDAVVGRMALDLETADRLLRELQPQPTTATPDDDTPVSLTGRGAGRRYHAGRGRYPPPASAVTRPATDFGRWAWQCGQGPVSYQGGRTPADRRHSRDGRSGEARVPAARDARPRTRDQAPGTRLPRRTRELTRAARCDRARRACGPTLSRRKTPDCRSARPRAPGSSGDSTRAHRSARSNGPPRQNRSTRSPPGTGPAGTPRPARRSTGPLVRCSLTCRASAASCLAAAHRSSRRLGDEPCGR